MKKSFFVFALVLGVVSIQAQIPMPTGWVQRGSHPQDYDVSLDTAIHRSGKAGASIKAKESASGFTTMMQSIKPDNYRGKRIRFSGYLKTKSVADHSGFWLRIDGAQMNKMLGFDNMGDRPVKGTTDWGKYEIVLDVPDNAEAIAFGVNLAGSGQVWVDDLKIEVVGKDVASTNMPMPPEAEAEFQKQLEEERRKNPEDYERREKEYNEKKKTYPLQPINLDFEK